MAPAVPTEGDANERRRGEERARARWSILRRALLGVPSSSPSGFGGAITTVESTMRVHPLPHVRHSMNAFPGFGVLDRTDVFVRPLSHVHEDDDRMDDYLGDEGKIDDGDWILVRNSYTSSNGRRVVRFLTRESSRSRGRWNEMRSSSSSSSSSSTTTATTTVHDRVESLLSHRRYGVDNTGNVRVWDAESTLAGFLLSVILDDDDDDDGGCEDILVGDGSTSMAATNALSRLREVLRSHLLTIPRGRRSPLPSFSGDGEEEEEKEKDGSSLPPITTTDDDQHCNVLELGAGQAGLAGLAAASAASTTSSPHPPDEVDDDPPTAETTSRDIATMRPLCLVLTDGHPRCVENNRVCAGMMMSSNETGGGVRVGGGADHNDAVTNTTTTPRVRVEVETLLWDSSPVDGAEACRRINALVVGDDDVRPSPTTTTTERVTGPRYHLCLASDCVHFRDFHDGLLTSIARVLVVDGIALLCQPRRGASLGDFMALVDAVNNGCPDGSVVIGDIHRDEPSRPLFRITLHEDFHPKVSAMHRSLLTAMEGDVGPCERVPPMSCSTVYDPNLHLPLLLELQKLRPYDDDVDGERARRFVKMRER